MVGRRRAPDVWGWEFLGEPFMQRGQGAEALGFEAAQFALDGMTVNGGRHDCGRLGGLNGGELVAELLAVHAPKELATRHSTL